MNETNKIFNLQNALMQVRHRITKEQFEHLEVPKDQFEKQVVAELTRQVADAVMKKIKINVSTDDNETIFHGKGYVLTEKEMLNTILEIIEMDDVQKENMKKAIEKQLGII